MGIIPYADPEKRRAQNRESVRRYRALHPERLPSYQDNRDRNLAAVKAHNDRLRAAVLAHYGTVCACCGSDQDPSIDHVNGSGAEHREQLFGHRNYAGPLMWRWLIRQGLPDGFQTLCKPCNGSKADGPACRLDHEALKQCR